MPHIAAMSDINFSSWIITILKYVEVHDITRYRSDEATMWLEET